MTHDVLITKHGNSNDPLLSATLITPLLRPLVVPVPARPSPRSGSATPDDHDSRCSSSRSTSRSPCSSPPSRCARRCSPCWGRCSSSSPRPHTTCSPRTATTPRRWRWGSACTSAPRRGGGAFPPQVRRALGPSRGALTVRQGPGFVPHDSRPPLSMAKLIMLRHVGRPRR